MNCKKCFALFLALVMLFSLFPASAFAQDGEELVDDLVPAEEPADGETPPSPTQAPETPPLAGEDNDLDDPDALPPEDATDLPEGAIASGTCGDNLTWTLDDRGRLVISGTGPMTDYSSESAVPWYSRRDAISYVTINSGATSIGTNAFNGLSNVTTVVTCDTLTSIGNRAFYNCSSLTGISIPAGVTTIGASNVGGCGFAFANCSSLTQITVNASNTTFSSADGVLFNKAGTILRVCPGGKSGSYTVPAGVTNIASDAFYKCASLTGITLPESLKTISSEAFLGCTGLSSVIIPSAVTSLGYRAFADCTSIASITFQGDAPSFSDSAVFRNVTAMAYYPPLASWTEDVFQNYGGTLRWSCSNKCGNNVLWVLDDDVLTIYGTGEMWNFGVDEAGYYPLRSRIKSVVIESGVTIVGMYAFRDCVNLESITIGESVTNILDHPCQNCGSMMNYIVDPNNTNFTAVDGVLFISHMKTIKYFPTGRGGSYTIPSGVTYVALQAFADCSSLSSVTIPDTVTSIGIHAFENSDCLETITFEGNAPNISSNAFEGVTATAYYPRGDASWTEDKLQDYGGNITWMVSGSIASGQCGDNVLWVLDDDGVLTIYGTGAMWDFGMNEAGYYPLRSRIQSVVIESGVTTVGILAFKDCVNLESISIGESVTLIRDHHCQNCGSMTNYILDPNNTTYAAVDGVLFLSHMETIKCFPTGRGGSYTIPGGVTYVAVQAFADCSSLSSVTIPDTVTSIGIHAFENSDCLETITFEGNAPNISSNAFEGVTATAYYPRGDASWTEDKLQDYGGNITWMVSGSIASGQCGDNVLWVLDDDGVLTIYGTGAMWDFGMNEAGYYPLRSRIQSVVIESGVTTVGILAFKDCVNLESISIGESVTLIRDHHCQNCGSMTNYILDPNNTTYAAVDGVLFLSHMETIKCFPTGRGGSYTIPGGVTYVAVQAFADCSSLSSVTIPDTVTSVGLHAFVNCGCLETITFEGNAPNISSDAFEGVTATAYYPRDDATWTANKLQNYGGEITWVMSAVVTSGQCGDSAFWSFDETTGVLTIFGSGTMTNYTSNTEVPWYHLRESISSVVIESGVTSVGRNAFRGYTALNSVSFPDGFKTVSAYAFYGCRGLTAVTLPDSVTTLGGTSFYSCSNLKSVNIPAGVKSISVAAFMNTGLESITIPSNVTSIAGQAFQGCSSLKTILFEGDAPSIDSTAFTGVTATAYYPANDATWTEDVRQNYGGTLTWVAVYPSGRCGDNLTWTLQDGVLTISGTGPMWDYSEEDPSYYAYQESITSVVIENGATSIGECAFSDCTALESVTIPSTVTSILWAAFARCSSLTVVTIPESVTEIGIYAFRYCSGLSSVTIPASVTSIGKEAFANCSSLTEISFIGSAPTFGSNVFSDVTATAYYQADDASWTEEVRQQYGGHITWVAREKQMIASGECGDNLTWVLYDDGCMVISGTGPMWDYPEEAPSYYAYRESITSVVIEDGATSIGVYAFEKLDAMTSVTIPSSVTSIEWGAFCICSSLTDVTIPASVTEIGGWAFGSCASLTSVTIPAGVTEIGFVAFANCSSLTEIRFEGSAPTIDDDVFYEVTATAYYPANDATWTEDVMQDYGGSITWVSYAPEPDHTPGDINGDGVVNNKDVTRLQRYLKDPTMQVNAAALDVNGDGNVNNKDVTRLLRYLKHHDVDIH